MADSRREIEPGSREEAQIAESVLYGIVWQLLQTMGPLISEQFGFQGAVVHATREERTGVVYDGLTIHMNSGDYRVAIEQVRGRE